MDRSRIFIASSGRTLLLAEKLRDALQSDFCDATLWTQEGQSEPSAVIIEMLEKATRRYDFAVVILSRDDVMTKETGDRLKARDNCIFEAGLFMAALGRERCFLVNSVEQRDLPSDLGGVISIPFKEPADLTNRGSCAEAMSRASALLKDAVQRAGRCPAQERVPVLSAEEVFRLERPHSDGGNLREGTVVVCDVQPLSSPEVALQVRYNLDHGISYLYFLQNIEDTIEKVIQALQVVAVGASPDRSAPVDFKSRLDVVAKEPGKVVEVLQRICETRSLLVSFLPDEPQFRFRLHNASDPECARLYMKYRGRGFMPWAEGPDAVRMWKTLPRFFVPDKQKRIFVPMTNTDFKGAEAQVFGQSVDRALSRYFPGLEDDVKRLCYGEVPKTRRRAS